MNECQYEYPATFTDPGYYCEDEAKDGDYCKRHDPEDDAHEYDAHKEWLRER